MGTFLSAVQKSVIHDTYLLNEPKIMKIGQELTEKHFNHISVSIAIYLSHISINVYDLGLV
jgi:hypothetical protein